MPPFDPLYAPSVLPPDRFHTHTHTLTPPEPKEKGKGAYQRRRTTCYSENLVLPRQYTRSPIGNGQNSCNLRRLRQICGWSRNGVEGQKPCAAGVAVDEVGCTIRIVSNNTCSVRHMLISCYITAATVICSRSASPSPSPPPPPHAPAAPKARLCPSLPPHHRAKPSRHIKLRTGAGYLA